MRRALLLIALSAAIAWGQSGLMVPTAGAVRDAEGSVRTVWGLRGNLLLSRPTLDAALSAAFSGRFAMVKTASEIVVLDASMRVIARRPAEEGPALFAFARDGSPLLACVPSASRTYRWLGSRFVDAPRWEQDLAGEPVAFAASEPGTVTVIVEREESLWLSTRLERDGRIVHEVPLPDIHAPVYLHDDGTLIFVSEGWLIVRRPVGVDQRLRLSAAVMTFERMGEDWVHAERTGESPAFAIHLNEGAVELLSLPGGRP